MKNDYEYVNQLYEYLWFYNILRNIDPMTSLMQSIRKQYLLSIDRTLFHRKIFHYIFIGYNS